MHKIKYALAALVMLCSAVPVSAQEQSIVIKGSDTMVHLVTALAEAAMDKDDDLDISVTGGGSGTGIAALMNGTTDIASSSRELQEKERQAAKVIGLEPAATAIAQDGLSIVVHPSNPVSEVTMEDLKKIFTGEMKTWKDLGGSAEPILIVSRESSSGTYVFFQEHVLMKQDFAVNARLMPATSGIVQAVQSDRTAIGYAGLGYAAEAAGKLKVLKVKSKTGELITPTEEAVRNGTYPIARPLYLITAKAPAGAAKAYIDFCLSDEGQKIVSELGYVRIR